jgi:membrane fusion protein, multidrug efflux system
LSAVRNPIISSEIAARISELKVRDGERFKRGQLLVSFDCEDLLNRLERARAALEKQQHIYEINTQLNNLLSVSQLEMIVSAAEVAEARADVKLGETMIGKCAIQAPFSGRAVAVNVQQHEYVVAGQPLLEILDDSELEIQMIVPSLWLQWLQSDYPFEIEIDETGGSYAARITRISGKVDPVSHSIKVYGRIVDADSRLLPGMSGNVSISPPE